jgi:hypothetical protein
MKFPNIYIQFILNNNHALVLLINNFKNINAIMLNITAVPDNTIIQCVSPLFKPTKTIKIFNLHVPIISYCAIYPLRDLV